MANLGRCAPSHLPHAPSHLPHAVAHLDLNDEWMHLTDVQAFIKWWEGAWY